MLSHGDYLLRPWTTTDAPALIAATGDDDAIERWTGVRTRTPEHAARWLQVQTDSWAEGSRYSFAVLTGRTLLGNVSVKPPTGEIGYWTAATARGRGVAPAAVEAATAWAFTALGLPALDLLHQVDNIASCRVAEKTGYLLAETLPPGFGYKNPGHRHTRKAG